MRMLRNVIVFQFVLDEPTITSQEHGAKQLRPPLTDKKMRNPCPY